MKITAKVHPNSSQNKIIKTDDQNFLIYTTSASHDNLANAAIINQLSKYFKIPKSQISIIHGQKSKSKIIQIDNHFEV